MRAGKIGRQAGRQMAHLEVSCDAALRPGVQYAAVPALAALHSTAQQERRGRVSLAGRGSNTHTTHPCWRCPPLESSMHPHPQHLQTPPTWSPGVAGSSEKMALYCITTSNRCRRYTSVSRLSSSYEWLSSSSATSPAIQASRRCRKARRSSASASGRQGQRGGAAREGELSRGWLRLAGLVACYRPGVLYCPQAAAQATVDGGSP
jgi:hypothetical protein